MFFRTLNGEILLWKGPRIEFPVGGFDCMRGNICRIWLRTFVKGDREHLSVEVGDICQK